VASRARPGRVAAPALDIEGVAAMGLDNWRANYAWPISDAEFGRLAAVVWDAYLDGVAELTGREQDAFKADIVLPNFLLQHLHLSSAAARLRQSSSDVPYGRHVSAHLTPDWEALGQAFAPPPSAPSRLGLGMGALAKNWILNASAPLPARLAACLGRADTWALGSRSPLRAAYQAQTGTVCQYLTLDDLLPAAPAASAAMGAGIHRAVRNCVEKINVGAQRLLGVSLDAESVAGAWMRRLNDLGALMGGTDAIDALPAQLLLTNLGQPSYRAVALAMRRRGVEIVGFHHGTNMGGQPFRVGSIVDLLPVDCFVVPSNACLRWRRDLYAHSRVSELHQARFEHVAQPHYRQWLDDGRRVRLPRQIQSVMIVGFPPNWLRYPHLAGHWALAQLDVEIALIKSLRAAGFAVLYKAHPEWEGQLKHLFAGLDCEFVGGHLETLWQRADAFVFSRISSSSFGFALCTNRPIVLLDVDSQDWVADAYALLARRCRMVPASIGESLRIGFDEMALIDALRMPVSAPEESFVVEAMCS
jgi:hypothetical protein